MTIQVQHRVRELEPADLERVVAIDAGLTGVTKRGDWTELFARMDTDDGLLGIAAVGPTGLDGYLIGELRAFEFGSEACGWITVLGVRPETTRQGLASALLEEARLRFAKLGVTSLRTMVRRTDVGLLSLFRTQGFVGGPFVQLEFEIPEEGR